MNFLDIRTVMFSHLITDAVCTAVLTFLWLQNRKRYSGMFFWVVDFVFQTTAALLIILRGSIPDWVSLGLASPLVIAGALMGYLGLKRFSGKRSPQVHNYILLAVFILIHFYFIFFQQNLEARTINVSLGLLILCFQCAWLMLRRTGSGLTRMTQVVGLVFVLFCLVSLIRIFVLLANPQPDNDFFHSGLYDTLILMMYQILLILLTFGLALMVNRRLQMEIKTQEEKFTEAFHSSPYAILITRLSDGMILDVNRGFEEIAGYLSSEAIGKTTLNLCLWVKETERQEVVAELSSGGEVRGREFQFRAKSGRELTGLFFAKILLIENERFVLSSISDITERKQAEKTIHSLARFPAENPNPVLRINRNGILLYVNKGALILLADWKLEEGKPAPEVLQSPTREVFEIQTTKTVELLCGKRTFSISIAPAQEDEYVNLYGDDITERKQSEEALKQKMDELERFNRLFVGREQRIIELKSQINELSKRLGEEAPYGTPFEEHR